MRNNHLILAFIFFAVKLPVLAQTDTSSHMKTVGLSMYGAIGLLPNSSLQSISDQLEAVAVKPFGQLMSNVILGMRREDARKFYESRLLFFKTPVRKEDNPGRYATLNGVGIGMEAGPKLVNSARWNVQVPLGWDAMIYRMKIRGDHQVDLVDVVQNAGPYTPAKLFTSNLTLSAGVGVDYKINLRSKMYDKVYISSKLSYQLPVVTKSKWRGEDITVNDLSTFKSNQLYFQLGLVFFPKKGMHGHW